VATDRRLRQGPITGKRRQLNRTVRAPNTRAGAATADVDLAKLIVEVSSGARPSAQVTVGELLLRWVEHRRRAWEARSPGQPDWTMSVIRKHFLPRVKADVDYGIALDPETVEALRAHRKRCVERALACSSTV
jgi:hypothetical protein